MHIPPKRRRRCLNVHHLRQQGQSLRQIGAQLQISHATVRADLQLLESHWSEIAAPAADDLLLDQLHILRCLLVKLVEEDLIQRYSRVSVPEFTRLYEIRASEIATVLREVRQTAAQIQRRAAQRETRPELDREAVQEPAEPQPELSTTNHSIQRISQPQQEIVELAPAEKVSAIHPAEPLPDDILEQAQAFLDELREHEINPQPVLPSPPGLADAAGGG